MADILCCCIGEFGAAVCCCFSGAVESPVSYLFCRRKIIENLKDKLAWLESEGGKVQYSVDAAKTDGAEVPPVAEEWLQQVFEVIERAKKVLEDHDNKVTKKSCPNPKVRYQITRRAAKEADAASELLQEGGFYRGSGENKCAATGPFYALLNRGKSSIQDHREDR